MPVRIKYALPPKFHFYKLTLWIYVNMHTMDNVCTMIFIVFIREILKRIFLLKGPVKLITVCSYIRISFSHKI